MVAGYAVVGRRVPDITGVAKVTGAAKFISDQQAPRMLIGKILHSPHARARILSIDPSDALALPGVVAVVTHADAPRRLYTGTLMNSQSDTNIEGFGVYDCRVLDDTVRYVGDAVAAIAAVDENSAEQALGLIKVEYDVLPAVFDELEAMKEGAPQVHDVVQRRQPADGMPGDEPVKGNLALHVCHKPIGDIEEGLREADFLLEEVGFTSKQRQAPLETFHCLADFDSTGNLTLWSPTQLPFLAQRMLAHIFDMPAGKIRIRNEYTGGGFGAGLIVFREPIAILLAKKSGRPVKLIYSRQEEFADRPTRACLGPYTMRMGVKKDGSITGIDRHVISRAGAHVEAAALSSLIAMAVGGPLYRKKTYRAEADAIYTNQSPCGAMRGFGNPEETFVREQVMDEAAEKLGLDPIEFRLMNLCKIGDPGPFGPDFPITSTLLADCIKLGAEKIGWHEWRARRSRAPGRPAETIEATNGDGQTTAEAAGARRRGIGLSCMAHNSGAWPAHYEHSNAYIKVNQDGTVILSVFPAPIGTNSLTSLAQVAAEKLGVRFEDMRVVWGDTEVTPFEIGSHASRTMYIVGQAVVLAADDARTKLLARASRLLGVPAEGLDCRDARVFVVGDPDRSLSVAEVAKQAIYGLRDLEEITGRGGLAPKTSPPPYQALFADIEVDVETGEIHVHRMISVNDCGTVVNPMIVEGQMEGGCSQGMGFALFEEPVSDKISGRLLTDDFDTYKIPTSLDIPRLETVLLEQPDPTGPFGAKGAGEPGTVNQAAAIANALYDAVGVRIWSLPMTPEKVLAALRAKSPS